MDYLFAKVADASFREDTPLRRAFRSHLRLVAKAMHDIEWVDSGDSGAGSDDDAIRACLPRGAEIATAIEAAEALVLQLQAAIAHAKKEGKK